MKMRVFAAALALLLAIGASARPHVPRSSVSIDLGYTVYEGLNDAGNGINVFKGYARSHYQASAVN